MVAKVEVQHATQRVVLVNTTTPQTLEPGCSYDATFSHLLEQPGAYVLACTITYQRLRPGQPAEPRTLKKAFKFPAVHALRVQPTVAQLEREFLVSVKVENTSP